MVRDIFVIGASAGGVEPLLTIARGLPPDFPAAIFIARHVPAGTLSLLPDLLSRNGHLIAIHPDDGQRIENATIYVAPPDVHMVVEDGKVRLARGPKENGHRPAIDPLFATAAHNFGDRVVGILLSGSGDDGTDGLRLIKSHGGIAIVQDPKEALHPQMPSSAARVVAVDAILGIAAIIAAMRRLAGEHDVELEPRDAVASPPAHAPQIRKVPTRLTCPDCGGVLVEEHPMNGVAVNAARYRCRVGHTYSTLSFDEVQSVALEEALWRAVRMFEERADFARQQARTMENRGLGPLRERFLKRARRCDGDAREIRDMMVRGSTAVLQETANTEQDPHEAEAVGRGTPSVGKETE